MPLSITRQPPRTSKASPGPARPRRGLTTILPPMAAVPSASSDRVSVCGLRSARAQARRRGPPGAPPRPASARGASPSSALGDASRRFAIARPNDKRRFFCLFFVNVVVFFFFFIRHQSCPRATGTRTQLSQSRKHVVPVHPLPARPRPGKAPQATEGTAAAPPDKSWRLCNNT